MTVDTGCYVCGKEGPAINGLCEECTMKEFWNPGAAFAATFGSLNNIAPPAEDLPGPKDKLADQHEDTTEADYYAQFGGE